MGVQSTNYINIQGWMRTELDLKGNDLLIYAIIYGFSQDGDCAFTGSLQYLADWCGATKQGVQKNLKNLIDRGLIKKTETYRNGVKFCDYSCIPYNSVVHPMQLSCIHTIEDTKEETISKDIPTADTFLGSAKVKSRERVAESKPKKKTLFEKCSDAVVEYTDDESLRKVLMDYLVLRLGMKDKPIYGVNQWTGILKRLNDISDDEVVAVVQQSIEHGWAAFYPLKSSGGGKQVFSEYGVVASDHKEEVYSDRKF